jgi:metal-responsive CopG/Arc/MetJ family transcriptional regulator
MQDKMIHKTIRVEKDLWDKFKKVAKYKDSDASKEIRKFIKRYLAENSQLFLEIEANSQFKV